MMLRNTSTSPKIKTLKETLLIGNRIQMSMVNNLTGQLWGKFAPRIKEIQHRSSEDKISLQAYPADFFAEFNPKTEFTKWASVPVDRIGDVPDGMETMTLTGGLYAVFDYIGSSADASSMFQYIYSEWVPRSPYHLDDRPHFEVLGSKYQNNDPQSEEEIWIPIKKAC